MNILETQMKSFNQAVENGEFDGAYALNTFANAVKGNASGEAVRIDDVSPVEHTMNVKVYGKNLFDISQIKTTSPATSYAYISEVGDNYFVVTTSDSYTGNGYCTIDKTLKEICPHLKVGKTYVLSAVSSNETLQRIYLRDASYSWTFNQSATITETMLNSYVTVYGFSQSVGQGVGNCIISNIQIEEGTTATEYTPYVDPTSVELTRCSKNLMRYPYYYNKEVVTAKGITVTSHDDGTITVNGTATDTVIYYLQHSDNKMKLRKGAKYFLSGCPKGGSSSTYMIQGTDGSIYQTDFGDGYFFTANKEDYYFYLVVYSGATLNNLVFKPQIEIGSFATEYESYNSESYTPNADGSVSGVTSLYPTTTLLTDTDNVIIECEYNQDTNKALSSALVTKDGTVVSQNADFAEVAEWADGNPDNEDRTGYFVCANIPVDGIVMKKATSVDDIKGVTIKNPAFAGNYTKDKVDSNGNLLPKYSYVAIIGFVPVIDNGTCTVGGRCMPDDNGCAVPSSNSMGYQVVNRIDENRVLIIIEPNGDMVQRVKTKVNELQETIDGIQIGEGGVIVVDQTYKPDSTNAQSGKAVAEALANIPTGGNSGVYVGSGDMPPDCNVQIDPDGEVLSIDQSYNPLSANPQSGVAVAEAVEEIVGDINTILATVVEGVG